MEKRHRRRIRSLRMLLLAVVAVCLFQLIRARYLSVEYEKQQLALRELKEGYAGEAAHAKKIFDWHTWKEEEPPAEPVILDQYAALYEENHDLAGWLAIGGMAIDYPVMQCEDDEYYLHHDYYGNESKYGCLYVRGESGYPYIGH